MPSLDSAIVSLTLSTGNILATAFAGLIALGIFEMDGMAGLAGWQWLFILQGKHVPNAMIQTHS